MIETRYVLCDSCGGTIYLGSEVYCFDGYCGVYCSAECYAEAHATVKVLDEDEAENCRCEIFDVNAIKNKKADIKRQIAELQSEYDRLSNLTEKGGDQNAR